MPLIWVYFYYGISFCEEVLHREMSVIKAGRAGIVVTHY
jgi:hypothetical protein